MNLLTEVALTSHPRDQAKAREKQQLNIVSLSWQRNIINIPNKFRPHSLSPNTMKPSVSLPKKEKAKTERKRLMELRGSCRGSNSHSSVLLSESVTSECARIAGYERLSKSMRLTGECDFDFSDGRKKNSKVGLGLLSKVFTFRKISSGQERPQAAVAMAAEKKKEKKRSSWLPDPEKRWPIQGW